MRRPSNFSGKAAELFHNTALHGTAALLSVMLMSKKELDPKCQWQRRVTWRVKIKNAQV